jgi:hypothetical protein
LEPTATVDEAATSSNADGSIFLNGIFAEYLRPMLFNLGVFSKEDKIVRQATEEFERNIIPRFNGDPTLYYSIPVDDPVLALNMGSDDGMLKLSGGDIQNVFDVIVKPIVRHVWDQINQTKGKVGIVKAVVLSGGFGENLYLQRRLREALPPDIFIQQSTKWYVLEPENTKSSPSLLCASQLDCCSGGRVDPSHGFEFANLQPGKILLSNFPQTHWC